MDSCSDGNLHGSRWKEKALFDRQHLLPQSFAPLRPWTTNHQAINEKRDHICCGATHAAVRCAKSQHEKTTSFHMSLK